MSNAKFQFWGIIELFGHQMIIGKVYEETIGTENFIRVDVPETKSNSAYTKFYGKGAIYAMTPTDENTALAGANELNAPPIEPWKLDVKQLPETTDEE